MAALTPRQHYRETLAALADKARAALPPAVNGRIAGAVKLVLLDEVTVQDNGSITVGSCTDPSKTYTLVGLTCTCDDFAHGKAPGGWCKHRIAAGLHKRTRELLAAEPVDVEQVRSSAPVALPEAPASVNFRFLLAGYELQITLRDHGEDRLFERLKTMLARKDMVPVPAKPTPARRPYAGQQGQQKINRDFRSGARS